MSGVWGDDRIVAIAAIAAVVIAGSYWWWRRELRRLHRERGYDAHDPQLNQEAWLNTKSKLRARTARGRNLLQLLRASIAAPGAALIALLFGWAALPSRENPALRWDMLGIAAGSGLVDGPGVGDGVARVPQEELNPEKIQKTKYLSSGQFVQRFACDPDSKYERHSDAVCPLPVSLQSPSV